MIPALLLFLAAYGGMLLLPRYRAAIVLTVGALFVVSGQLSWREALAAVDWNVLLMMAGTMGVVHLFVQSRMPARLAELLLRRVRTVRGAAVALALLAGGISALVDNVATVLMVAPVALAVCRRLEVNPAPMVIAIAVSSNLPGAATLVGDTTAVMLGSAMDMRFTDFFRYHGRPSIFFAVELGALTSAAVLAWLFRREKRPVPRDERQTEVTDRVPTVLLGVTLVLLVGASFLPWRIPMCNGLICCGALAVGMADRWRKKRTLAALLEPVRAMDFQTLGVLLGLFVVIGGLSRRGVIDGAAQLLARVGGSGFRLYSLVVWGSAAISAFVDNIPYVAAMIPVIGGLAGSLGIDPTALYFGLLSGATLGGNCTPVGASANIAALGLLEREGRRVPVKEFLRVGIPFTLAALLPAYGYIWLVYG